MFVRSSSKESSRLRSPSITSPDGKPTQEGWLWKFARSGKWQRRWFRLHGHYLKYYNPAGDPATGAEVGEVKAAYDLYDINKQKEVKRIAAMDGVELMIPFVHEVEKEDADGSTTKMKVEEVYQLKADSDAEADAWLRNIDAWRVVQRPANTPNHVVAKLTGDEGNPCPEVCGFLGRLKQTKVTSNAWQRQYFKIDASMPFLVYYSNDKCVEKDGRVAFGFKHMVDVRTFPLMDSSGGGYELLVSLTSGTKYQLRADTAEEAAKWQNALLAQIKLIASRAASTQQFFEDAVNGMQVHSTLERSASGDLGLSLEAIHLDGFECVVVDSFVPGTPAHAAHADGVLKVGDVLIEVNGQATLRSEPERWAMPFSDVLDLFQSDKIELRLARTKLSEEETAQNLAAIKMQAIHRGRAARRDSTQAPHTSGKQGKYSGRAAQRKASQLEEGPTK